MATIYCNFSDINYRHHQEQLVNHVLTNKIFDSVMPFTKEWLIDTNFYSENKKILDSQRLCGYTLWKPFIILNALNTVSEGDIVVYMDCGDIPLHSNINSHIKDYLSHQDQYFIDTFSLSNRRFTKRDCFVLMNCDSDQYWNDIQMEAGFLAFRKTTSNIDFVSEWLHYCKNENIITDLPNVCGLDNFADFVDHRHDQSVISLLKKKYLLPTDNSVRHYINFNVQYHKDGESFSNSTAKWDCNGNKL